MIRIALDAMGGDGAPDVPIAAAVAALDQSDASLEVLLVGDADVIGPRLPVPMPERLRILAASESIGVDESPALAVRRKPDSSIVVGLQALKDGSADAFLSAGSTGAVMAGSLLILGQLPGVDRPAVGALVPTAVGKVLVLDAGANVATRPQNLHQFARLGTVYLRDMLGIERPRVGLLNVGEEAEKGDDLAVAAFGLLSSDTTLNFVGNVEGHRIIDGVCDVLVCDGFVGNVLLKFYESMAGFVTGLLSESFPGARSELEGIFRFLDYTGVGGAPLLGVAGVTILCHGASPPRAIRNAIKIAVDAVRAGTIDALASELERMPTGEPA